MSRLNAEHLHAIVDALRKEIDDSHFPKELSELVSARRGLDQDRNNPAYLSRIRTLQESLQASLCTAPSNDFPPGWRENLEEMGLADLFGSRLLVEVESASVDRLQQIATRLEKMVVALREAASSLSALRIGRGDLAPGEFEIGFLIPRPAVDDNLGELAGEFMALKAILGPFSELVGEGRPEFRVRSISSTAFQVFLDSAPATAAVVATTFDRVIAAYKNLLEIRELRRKMADRAVPEEALDGINRHMSELMEASIREIVEEVLAEAPGPDEGRLNELRVEINLGLNEVAERIDRGYNVQVRTGELPDSGGEEAEFDPAYRDAAEAVLEAQKALGFVNPTGETPILKLEPPPEAK